MSVEAPSADEVQRKPWDQWEGEPSNWYGRFVIFRDLGPGRSLAACSRTYCQQRNKPLHPTNVAWSEAARVWKWRERALAWDTHERNALTLVEANRKAAARERRSVVINEGMDIAREMIRAADLENLSVEEARALFPESRKYLKDMIEADRKEWDKNLYDVEVEENQVLITADDLRAAQRELEKQEAERGFPGEWEPDLRWKAKAATGTVGRLQKARSEKRLIIVPHLDYTRANLPAVHAEGLTCRHVLAATRTSFARTLHRECSLGHPTQLLQVDLRSSALGIEFATNLADGYWLRERLGAVKVLVLGCYAGEQAADWFAGIGCVVTLREEMPPCEAQRFKDTFWAAIGHGEEAKAAVLNALGQCEPALAGCVRWSLSSTVKEPAAG
jgi:hypothetical protein